MSPEGICLECQRTVHLGRDEEPVCPVCGSRVLGPQIEKARLERIGKNEAVFKQSNERRAERQEGSVLHVVCECGDLECREEVDIDAMDYESVRKHQSRFVVLPGHEIIDAEEIVDRNSGYFLVQKVGAAEDGATPD